MVTNILLSLLLLSVVTSVALAVIFVLRIKQMLLDFIVPVEDGKPSALATACEAVASMIGRAVTAQIKATLMGMQSGDKRQVAAVEGAIAQDQAGQMGFGSLLQSFPILGKSIKKNPQLMDIAMQILAQRLAPKSSAPAGSNGHADSPSFNL